MKCKDCNSNHIIGVKLENNEWRCAECQEDREFSMIFFGGLFLFFSISIIIIFIFL